jgi:peptidoglycan/xylan/chitin deacetylase (PgdA/CDA1 family)
MKGMRRAGAATAVAVALHAAPALAAVGPLRRRLLPGLAGRGHPHRVALTFDDGPHPEATPQVMRILDSAGVRATFFLLGQMVQQHPQVVRALVAAGHEVGVHGHEHRLLLRRSPSATRTDLRRAATTIAEVTGALPRWWRPPYGVASTVAVVAARQQGLSPVLWTHWGRDWTRRATSESVTRSVLRHPLNGGTILLHDSDHAGAARCWEATVAALPAILSACRAHGLHVGPLRDHGIASPPGRSRLTS